MQDKLLSVERFFQCLNKETRYCVIECAVHIEEMTSNTLGRILRIDWKKSESLGYGSSSLSFDTKIRLIQDLKGVTPKNKTKFQCFMSIRNKFAHIAEIDSFKSCFTLIKSSKERKNELKSWFPSLNLDSEDFEESYKYAYFLLTLELFSVFYDINLGYSYEKGQIDGRKDAEEMFLESVKSTLEKTDEGKKILEEIFEKIMKKNLD